MPLTNWRAHLPRRKPADAPPHRHPRLARRLHRLERSSTGLEERLEEIGERLTALEQGLLEQRRLNLRVAELTDLVTELVGAAARGEDEFRRVLGRADGQPDQQHGG